MKCNPTFISRETKRSQPKILSGRNCDDLPPIAVGRIHRKVYSAFTGPGGGLASVNPSNHTLDIDDKDVDFIDNDDDLPDDQPNAYVTCQQPPPRKSPFSDMAEYFKKPTAKPPITSSYRKNRRANASSTTINNNDIDADNNNKLLKTHVRNVSSSSNKSSGSYDHYASKDSLECTAPSWRGEAPSPLSPHPSRAPHNAFLQFGDSPLNYELSVPSFTNEMAVSPSDIQSPTLQSGGSVIIDYNSSRSCENICNATSPGSHDGECPSLGGGSLGSLEGVGGGEEGVEEDSVMLVSCQDSKQRTVNSLVLPERSNNSQSKVQSVSPCTPLIDQNSNPLLKLVDSHTRSASLSPKLVAGDTFLLKASLQSDQNLNSTQSAPSTPRNDDPNCCDLLHTNQHSIPSAAQGDHKPVSLQQKIMQQSLANKSASCKISASNSPNNNNSVNGTGAASDLTNEGGLVGHRAKFLTLELVEGCTLSGQSS